MKSRLLSLIAALLMTGFSLPGYAQTYEKLWKDVEAMEKKDLPKSVLKLTETIYNKALKERNSPEMINAYLMGMQYRQKITPDSFQVDVKGLAKWAQEAKEPLDAAILNSVLGDIYGNYISDFRYGRQTPTAITDVPEDMNEWSLNLFVQKSYDSFRLSLKDRDLLAKTSVDLFRPIVLKGDAGSYYHHDMLHMLAMRAVSSLAMNSGQAGLIYPQTGRNDMTGLWGMKEFTGSSIPQASDYDYMAECLRIYQSMLQYYVAAEDTPAIVLTNLERLEFINNNLYNKNYAQDEQALENPYYIRLQRMQQQYAATDICAEVYINMVEYARSRSQLVEALRLAREGIARYPGYFRINVLKNAEQDILNPRANGRVDEAAYPGESINVNLEYCNLPEITFRIYPVNLPADSKKLSDYTEKSFRSTYAGKMVAESNFALPATPDYRTQDTVLKVPAPGTGIYLVEIFSKEKNAAKNYQLLYVSKLKVLNRTLPGKQAEFVVVDAQSGHPVPQAELILYNKEKGFYKQVRTLTADEQGTAVISKEEATYVQARKGADVSMQPVPVGYTYYREPGKSKTYEVMNLFTDRAIYRPGQTVYVSGIAYAQNGDSTRVLTDKEYSLKLFDTNSQLVGEKKVRTNEFGSFAGEFILPSPCLPGVFSLRTDNGWTSIRVEEYKRPTFDVTFLPVEGTYNAGDSVWVKGVVKTFSGVPVQNTEVKYTVERRTPSFWRWMYTTPKPLASGEVKTNDAGEFSVRVFLEPDRELASLPVWYTSYRIEAVVTDAAGETQSNATNLRTGSASVVLSTDLPEEIQRETMGKITFFARNLEQQPVKVSGEYAVYELTDKVAEGMPPLNVIPADGGKLGKCLLKSEFTANEAFEPQALNELPSGLYRLILTVKDGQGREAVYRQNLILFAADDNKPPYQTLDWFRVLETEFGADKDASLVFGTSGKDIYVLYDVFCGDKRLESKRFQLTDSVVRMTFPYKEAYGDGILVQFAFVKNGKFYRNQARLTKILPDKKLEMKWDVFRDKLKPGQEEEWRLSIRYPDGKPAEAELLAAMYDASLDKLIGHNWSLRLSFPRFLPSGTWNGYMGNTTYFYLNFPLKSLRYKPLSYDNLKPSLWFEQGVTELLLYCQDHASTGMAAGIQSKNFKARSATAPGVAMDNLVFEEEVVVSNAEASDAEETEPTGQPRTNFAETAFFYPQLRTNAAGEVSFSFLLPESLTEWKFMGLAHTKNMDWNQLTAKAVASKEFMLQPNMPRFVRVGDRTSIAASIMNLTDQTISGTVRMELFNPETDKVFLSQKQKFSVEAGKTSAVSFSFMVNETVSVMACRMVADGGTFSDGEQRYIPVLTNKEWMTESLPMAVNGEETKSYSLADLFNKNSKTATDRRLTIEFTGNPAWYAVQALPSLSNPADDNAISWVSAYYGNNVSASIVEANPRIKAVFDSWKAQGGTKETLWSNLQKNQELKNILLDQSPWVTEAINEADQKQRIALLFDLNTQRNGNAIAVEKLRKLQSPTGTWSWYNGMDGSRYVTQFVMETLTRMQELTGTPLAQDVLGMYAKAFDYLNEQALEEYKLLLKAEKEGAKDLQPSELTVHYLYLCSLSDTKLPDANRKANDYFISKLAQSSRRQTIYGKAISAIILNKAGKVAAAKEFMASLKEYAVETKDMGMYYDTKDAYYSWFNYKIPTQVAVIEAMEQVDKDMAAVEQLKLWLLKQKQTQSWDTPLSTVDAIYALLQRGTNLLDNQGDVRITLGKEVIETFSPAKTTVPGLGYVKETFTGKQLTPGMKEITVEKRDAGVAWGAVYAQYLEDLDQVSKHESPLSVDKKLYVERVTDGRAQLTPLTEVKTVKTGDKIVVRMTIRTDRDMDFVQLKDQSAACFEPLASLSGYRWQSGIGYYVAVKDASMEYFFDGLRKGTYILESSFYISRAGDYASGIATIQSAYAPEFSANSASVRIRVSE